VTPGIDADAWVVEGSRICRNTAPKVDVKSAETDTPPKNDNQNYVDGTAKGIDEYPGPQFMNVRGSKGSIFNPSYLSPN